MQYLDFDLSIEPTAEGFTARVNSPGGEASVVFQAPFSDLQIENFLLRLGRRRQAVRGLKPSEIGSAKEFGGQLFEKVFTGDVRACLWSSLDKATSDGLGLRVRLHLAKVPALADLPWEFLYNARMNRFLSLSAETPLIRFLELPERIKPLAVKPPLRILMMVSSPTDYAQLDVARELAKMDEALADLTRSGMVIVEREEEATLPDLQRRLRHGPYHVFHFIGHGGFDRQAGDGLLVFEEPDRRGRQVPAQFLGTLLHDHRPLRMAVLNACEGGRASRDDPFAGTAQSLIQQGLPAVIAMQFEVSDEAAICFTRSFYGAIADGDPVDAALAAARKAIFAEVSEIEWGTPVLYMRSPDGKIFDVEKVSDAGRTKLQVDSLIAAATRSATSGDIPGAVDKIRQVLTLEPGHEEAKSRLLALTQELELAALYDSARKAMDAGLWREALEHLRRVQTASPGYRDVATIIRRAESELAKVPPSVQVEGVTLWKILDSRWGITGIIAGLWLVNWIETNAEDLWSVRTGAWLGYDFAAAFSWFERGLSFDRHDLAGGVAVYLGSIAYFALPVVLLALTLVCLVPRPTRDAYRVFAFAILVCYGLSLPFYLFLPIPERWAYPESHAILLSDLWSAKLIEAIRPISGVDNCFPSFHVSGTFATVFVWFVFRLRFRYSIGFLGGTVALSTMLLGIHWLADIIAGFALAVVGVRIALWMNERVHAQLTAPRPLRSAVPAFGALRRN
jgi:membrane-associated phospholipid phosphatase